jgi:hypothetical protein
MVCGWKLLACTAVLWSAENERADEELNCTRAVTWAVAAFVEAVASTRRAT